MMSFALGSLGWTEFEFYNSSLKSYILASRGYHEEKKLLQGYMRRQTMILFWALGGKEKDENKVWPIEGQENKAVLRERLLKRKQEFEAKQAEGLK